MIGIGLVLGYSEDIEEDSHNGEWLKKTFGRFKSIQFHLEETSDTTIRVTVESHPQVGFPAIYERFGGKYESCHRTKNGNIIYLYYHDKLLMLTPYKAVTSLPEAKVAAVA